MNLLFSQENLVVDYGAMIARRLFQFLSSENFYFYNLFIVRFLFLSFDEI